MSGVSLTTATRTAYDAVASVYADHFARALADQPVDRAIVVAFAEVSGSIGGPVLDLGCGPGQVTAFVSSLGVDVAGVDLSPNMVRLARERHPGIQFEVGSLADIRRADATLAGIIAWYSFIHIPPDQLGDVIAEMRRALRPGGHLLLACHGVDGPGEITSAFDHAVLTAYRWSTDHLGDLLREHQLAEVARISRRPSDGERFPQIRILARG